MGIPFAFIGGLVETAHEFRMSVLGLSHRLSYKLPITTLAVIETFPRLGDLLRRL